MGSEMCIRDSNLDLSSQLGIMIVLADKNGKANIMHYNSYKSKRVVRSVLGGDTYAFADAFDIAFHLRHDLKRLLQKEIKLTLLTDSMSLFKIIINSTVTTEKRLMIDIAAVREAYERSDIDYVGWIPSTSNIANGLTKLGICSVLSEFMTTNVLTQEIRTVIDGRFKSVPLSSDEFLSLEKENRECELSGDIIQNVNMSTVDINSDSVNDAWCTSHF